MNAATRRDVMLGSAVALAGTAAVAPSAASAAQRETPPFVADSEIPVDVIGDGRSHPLRERFERLEDAQKIYPRARSLDDEIDWCAVQHAIYKIQQRGTGAIYLPNRGGSYVFNRGIKLNPNRVTLRGGGTVLDFRNAEGDTAITFASENGPQWGHEKHVFQGFDVIGHQEMAGLYFATNTKAMSSRTQIRDTVIREFGSGVLFGDRSYMISFHHVSIYNCYFGINCPYGLIEAGETVSFSQCSLFGCYCTILNTAGFELKFFATSLVYSERIVWDNNGLIDFLSCRVEIQPPKDVPFHNGVGRVDFYGGFFLINGQREVKAQELFAFNDPVASVHMIGLRGWNWISASGKLTNGPGKIFRYEGNSIDTPPKGYV
ncbi:MAG: hypothetical protein AAGB11_10725 [Pseudomonadota bacterium]